MRYLLLLLYFYSMPVFAQNKQPSKKETNFLEQLLLTRPELFRQIINQKDSLRVQIVYTKIDNDKKQAHIYRLYV